jgi:type I restriction enzyme S subunit
MGIREGYKNTEVGIIPQEWEVFYLNQVCERISVGLATSVTKYYRDSGVPIIRNLNIKDGYFDSKDMLFLEPEFAKQNLTKAANAYDVLTVHTGSNLGLTCVLPPEFNNSQTFTTLITTPQKNKLDSFFLCYCLVPGLMDTQN